MSSRKILQLFAAAVFGVLHFGFIWTYFSIEQITWFTPLFILIAFYLADFLSGIVHFVLDYRYTKPDSGLRDLYFYEGNKGAQEYVTLRSKVMKNVSALDEVVFDFKVHHISPGTLARRSFLTVCLPIVYFGSLPMICVLFALSTMEWISGNLILMGWCFISALSLAQYAHSCAHKRQVPLIPKLLQKLRLFISKEKHDSHHTDLGQDFCLLNGWANPLVNVIFKYAKKHSWYKEEGLIPQ